MHDDPAALVPGIGQLREHSLHAVIKALYARPGDALEVRVAGCIIDVVRADGTLIEVQTSNFSALKRKLPRLLPEHRVRVIYPVIGERWITRLLADGTTTRRKSPLKQNAAHLFRQLVFIVPFIPHPNLTVEALTVSVEQYLQDDGAGSWRRKGWSIIDTRLLRVLDQAVFDHSADYAALLPPDLPDPFTTAHLVQRGRVDRRLAGQMAYCLRHMHAIDEVGKAGNAITYRRVSP